MNIGQISAVRLQRAAIGPVQIADLDMEAKPSYT
jgi:hypothetical protein